MSSLLRHMYHFRITALWCGVRIWFWSPFGGASEALARPLHVAFRCGGACREILVYRMFVQIRGSFQKLSIDGFEEG
jgi:hypothetical protein